MRTILSAILLWAAASAPVAAKGTGTLGHVVWLGPGCEQLVEMDQLYELVTSLIAQSGVRPRERLDRVELQCSGRFVREPKTLRAYLTADVLITRQVPYQGGSGRLLLNRGTHTVEIESRSFVGLQQQLRRALHEVLRGPLQDYGKGRFLEVSR